MRQHPWVIVTVVSVLLAVVSILLLVSSVKYDQLRDAVIVQNEKVTHYNQLITEACSTTGAAAKLDLSSFVPLCKEANSK